MPWQTNLFMLIPHALSSFLPQTNLTPKPLRQVHPVLNFSTNELLFFSFITATQEESQGS